MIGNGSHHRLHSLIQVENLNLLIFENVNLGNLW